MIRLNSSASALLVACRGASERIRTKRFPVLIALLVCVMLIQTAAAFAQDRHFLWRVQSKTASCFVLGSIHLMKPEHYPLSRMIENAFEQSAAVAVEVDLNGVTPEGLQKLMAEAFYPEGDALDKHISVQTMEQVAKGAQGLGLGIDWIKRQKPWFLAASLPSIALIKAGYDPRYGIDLHFLTTAANRKRVIELESFDAQMKMLAELTALQQEALLRYTLNDLEVAVKEADALVDAWKTGDTAALEAITTKGFKSVPDLETVAVKILYDRNRVMADRIEQIMKTQEDCFVIIGAAHLVGEKSVLKLLRDKGLRVDQL